MPNARLCSWEKFDSFYALRKQVTPTSRVVVENCFESVTGPSCFPEFWGVREGGVWRQCSILLTRQAFRSGAWDPKPLEAHCFGPHYGPQRAKIELNMLLCSSYHKVSPAAVFCERRNHSNLTLSIRRVDSSSSDHFRCEQ